MTIPRMGGEPDVGGRSGAPICKHTVGISNPLPWTLKKNALESIHYYFFCFGQHLAQQTAFCSHPVSICQYARRARKYGPIEMEASHPTGDISGKESGNVEEIL